jgi:N-acetylglucosamine-6-sulfatase
VSNMKFPSKQAAKTSTSNRLALNTDFFPTFTDLAGATTPEYVDGRSLRPLSVARSLPGGPPSCWSVASTLTLVYLRTPSRSTASARGATGGSTSSSGGFRELYDSKSDPYKLLNSYDAPSPPVDLDTRLEALKGCAGATCRAGRGRAVASFCGLFSCL